MPKRRKSEEDVTPLEQPYQNFTLYYLRNKNDREDIKKLLVGDDTSPGLAANSILNYLLTPRTDSSDYSCNTVIVEDRYWDQDHSSAIASFYSKAFKRVETECKRLHFFCNHISAKDLFDGNVTKFNKAYLGFCVLRPFENNRIGRTVLKRLNYDPSLEFPTCVGDFEVHLAGCKININGVPFIEQDSMVSACASTSIWMSTTTLGHRYGLTQMTTSQITITASQYSAKQRVMPAEGLSPEQMVHCLRSMEYEPILKLSPTPDEANHLIYSYVESEFPPILLCEFYDEGHHTLVSVGHGYQYPVDSPRKTQIAWAEEPPIEFSRSSEWVPYFLVNDDQRGCFRKLSFVTRENSIYDLEQCILNAYNPPFIDREELKTWTCPVTIDLNMEAVGVRRRHVANLWGILVPLPEGVILTTEQAESKSARLIRLWHYKQGTPLPDDLVLRTYLTLSNEYKARITHSEMNPWVKSMLRGKPMPKWIWVTEISSLASYNTIDTEKWLLNGQVIIDATGNAFTPDFLSFHYIEPHRTILATMMPDHKDEEDALNTYWYSKTSTRYPGWIR